MNSVSNMNNDGDEACCSCGKVCKMNEGKRYFACFVSCDKMDYNGLYRLRFMISCEAH